MEAPCLLLRCFLKGGEPAPVLFSSPFRSELSLLFFLEELSPGCKKTTLEDLLLTGVLFPLCAEDGVEGVSLELVWLNLQLSPFRQPSGRVKKAHIGISPSLTLFKKYLFGFV